MPSSTYVCSSCLRLAGKTAIRPTSRAQYAFTERSRAATFTSRVVASRPLQQRYVATHTSRAIARPQYAVKTRTTLPLQPTSLLQRTFATTTEPSTARPAQAIENPRNDDSGNPMLISISPRASARLHKISSDQDSNLALRVSVESGGCHGFQYLMDLTDLSKKPATEEDTIFEGEKGEKVVIDESSLELLSGSTVDYTMELIGSQFIVTGIPGATSSCGCGTSFDIQL